MKRRRKIKLDEIADWKNLEIALAKALRGKRRRKDALVFLADMPSSLAGVGRRLRNGKGVIGGFREFRIHDPKERLICAPCFADRVAHHAVMNKCEGSFEKWQIEDSYACRRGKGLHAAIERAAGFSRRYRYFLKCDVRHYFETVPRARLVDRVMRRFPGDEMGRLWSSLIDSWRGGSERGLPIGALTSQHLGNFYLGFLDRQIKQAWKIRGYVRYMDDFVLWGDCKNRLKECAGLLSEWVDCELELELKPMNLQPTCHSMEFLGTRIRQGGVGLSRRSRRRYTERMRTLEREWRERKISEIEVQNRMTALSAFTEVADCAKFRRAVASALQVVGR